MPARIWERGCTSARLRTSRSAAPTTMAKWSASALGRRAASSSRPRPPTSREGPVPDEVGGNSRLWGTPVIFGALYQMLGPVVAFGTGGHWRSLLRLYSPHPTQPQNGDDRK